MEANVDEGGLLDVRSSHKLECSFLLLIILI